MPRFHPGFIRIFCLFACLTAFAGLGNAAAPPHREEQPDGLWNPLEIRGPVKSVRSTPYAALLRGDGTVYQTTPAGILGGEPKAPALAELLNLPADTLRHPTLVEYTQDGKVLRQTVSDPAGKIVWSVAVEFDAEGRTTAQRLSGGEFPEGGALAYSYDPRTGALLSVLPEGAAEGIYAPLRNEYDEHGRLLRSTTFEMHDKPVKTESGAWTTEHSKIDVTAEYAYDAKGRVIAVTLSDKGGPRSSGYRHDEGERRRYHYRGGDLSGQSDEYTEYDAQGRLVARRSFFLFASGDRRKSAEEYTRDAQGRITTVRVTNRVSAGGAETRAGKRYVYDGKGNMTGYTETGPGGGITDARIYTYDAQGNWLRGAYRNISGAARGPLVPALLERTITYYP